ncbi:tRNA (N6-threonylcarbamoyladenosine(37)-N6)-methyltransferase TrmO [Actinomycetospora succinea]|uniref:tRNA (N6-threonylcarbamoyladenosine(37)-N6)-methyltransferase TrmO n=1 Tax=Actinomycetospora succinea TaxID=663603 RepID=UPI00105E7E50|nr:tRNA (N6-threonylcarbamoyladenosine(37)-N6)-methyltransferase TrmO [Actinomycetospora succinea]
MSDSSPVLRVLGHVSSPLADRSEAPRQGDEGGPEAVVRLDPDLAPALADVSVGDEVLLITWLDRGDRSVLRVHPRNDTSAPLTGVFSTRSPDRPNPLGLHQVRVLAIEGTELRVSDLEAVDGTPIVDIKSTLGPIGSRCHDRR